MRHRLLSRPHVPLPWSASSHTLSWCFAVRCFPDQPLPTPSADSVRFGALQHTHSALSGLASRRIAVPSNLQYSFSSHWCIGLPNPCNVSPFILGFFANANIRRASLHMTFRKESYGYGNKNGLFFSSLQEFLYEPYDNILYIALSFVVPITPSLPLSNPHT